MKSSAILCTVLAAGFGFSSAASAQDWGGRRDHRDQRWEQRDDRREARIERRHDRQERRVQRQHEAWRQGHRPGYVQSAPAYRGYQPNYYAQPGYYAQPNYARGYQRGGYLPHQYRHSGYYVNDWRSHPGLYAPPHGHQWMNVGSDFLLVALATGLIANMLQ